MICKICARETDSAALSHSSELPSASSVSSMSKSPSFPATSKSEKLRTTWLRTFWRRNQSIVAFETIRWKSSGSSAAGRSTYFSERRIIASCTMSSAASSSRTAYTARFQARFSTLFRKSASSLSVAKESKPQGRRSKRRDYLIAQCGDLRHGGTTPANAIIQNYTTVFDPRRCLNPRPRGGSPQAPHPPHEGEARRTDGFSSEKFTEVPRIMETSAPDLKRVPAPSPHPAPAATEPNGSEI